VIDLSVEKLATAFAESRRVYGVDIVIDAIAEKY